MKSYASLGRGTFGLLALLVLIMGGCQSEKQERELKIQESLPEIYVEGRVSQGRALPEAQIWVRPLADLQQTPRWMAKTDAQGRYRFQLDPVTHFQMGASGLAPLALLIEAKWEKLPTAYGLLIPKDLQGKTFTRHLNPITTAVARALLAPNLVGDLLKRLHFWVAAEISAEDYEAQGAQFVTKLFGPGVSYESFSQADNFEVVSTGDSGQASVAAILLEALVSQASQGGQSDLSAFASQKSQEGAQFLQSPSFQADFAAQLLSEYPSSQSAQEFLNQSLGTEASAPGGLTTAVQALAAVLPAEAPKTSAEAASQALLLEALATGVKEVLRLEQNNSSNPALEAQAWGNLLSNTVGVLQSSLSQVVNEASGQIQDTTALNTLVNIVAQQTAFVVAQLDTTEAKLSEDQLKAAQDVAQKLGQDLQKELTPQLQNVEGEAGVQSALTQTSQQLQQSTQAATAQLTQDPTLQSSLRPAEERQNLQVAAIQVEGSSSTPSSSNTTTTLPIAGNVTTTSISVSTSLPSTTSLTETTTSPTTSLPIVNPTQETTSTTTSTSTNPPTTTTAESTTSTNPTTSTTSAPTTTSTTSAPTTTTTTLPQVASPPALALVTVGASKGSWKQVRAQADWSARNAHTTEVFPCPLGNQCLWMLGGWSGISEITNKNEVWYSLDGVDWVESRAASAAQRWSGRNNHTSAVFACLDNPAQSCLWLMGGYAGAQSNYDNANDVWYSHDGKDWTLATTQAPWAKRNNHSSAVFKCPQSSASCLWIMGGWIGSNSNDVWYSANGKDWIQAPAAGWSARNGHASAVLNDKLWVVGGWDGQNSAQDGFLQDVWSSADGLTWTKVTDQAEWTPRGNHALTAFDNKLWVTGGWDPTLRNPSPETWYSLDGLNWRKPSSNSGWAARIHHSSLAFQNQLWVIGGEVFSGNNGAPRQDVWAMSKQP